MKAEDLEVGKTYRWEDLAEAFGFKPDYFGAAGGMISRPELGALLLVTNEEIAKSFDYHDYWDRGDLIYGGRGQVGDQKYEGQNRDLGDNSKTNYVLVANGSRQMRFAGIARCLRWWWDTGPDRDGTERKLLRFHHSFAAEQAEDLADPIVEEYVGIEGTSRIVQHRRIERDRALTASAKARWKILDPLLRCEVCQMSFAEVYGALGDGYVQAHHRVPLGQLAGATQTRIEDLAPVCANCHQMLHRPPGMSVEELREHPWRRGASGATGGRQGGGL